MASLKEDGIWSDVGCFLNTMTPIARREKWSMTTATHQQSGQIWGKASGVHAAHMPSDDVLTQFRLHHASGLGVCGLWDEGARCDVRGACQTCFPRP